MEQLFLSIPISDLEVRIGVIVEKAVQKAIEEKEPVRYYSMNDAVLRTGKAKSTLYTDHCKGRLHGFKCGRQVRFTEEQLVAYLEGR